MAKNLTYIENDGRGYNTEISEIAKLMIEGLMNEVLTFPAGTTLVEEVNVNGVILRVANGKDCTLGEYPLYEEYNKITTPTYKLPNYLEKPNIISNFPDSGKQVGDTVDWRYINHEHPDGEQIMYVEFRRQGTTTLFDQSLKNWTLDFNSNRGIPDGYYGTYTFSIAEGDIINNDSKDELIQDFQPELIALTPYIIVDYRG
ncbi:MAG: YdgA family protein [Alphaproteobacteria bacterium]|jgi:hypothetical protein|nr:YdgA family protein [Alphaproteobacteria bacterium]